MSDKTRSAADLGGEFVLDANALKPEDFVVYDVEVRTRLRLALHPEVINRVDDEWRSHLYDLYDPEDIVAHLLYNLLQGRELNRLDGWADLPAFAAFIDDMNRVEVDIVGTEPYPDRAAGMLKWVHQRWVDQLQTDGRDSEADF